jgi:hypothetical protein
MYLLKRCQVLRLCVDVPSNGAVDTHLSAALARSDCTTSKYVSAKDSYTLSKPPAKTNSSVPQYVPTPKHILEQRQQDPVTKQVSGVKQEYDTLEGSSVLHHDRDAGTLQRVTSYSSVEVSASLHDGNGSEFYIVIKPEGLDDSAETVDQLSVSQPTADNIIEQDGDRSNSEQRLATEPVTAVGGNMKAAKSTYHEHENIFEAILPESVVNVESDDDIEELHVCSGYTVPGTSRLAPVKSASQLWDDMRVSDMSDKDKASLAESSNNKMSAAGKQVSSKSIKIEAERKAAKPGEGSASSKGGGASSKSSDVADNGSGNQGAAKTQWVNLFGDESDEEVVMTHKSSNGLTRHNSSTSRADKKGTEHSSKADKTTHSSKHNKHSHGSKGDAGHSKRHETTKEKSTSKNSHKSAGTSHKSAGAGDKSASNTNDKLASNSDKPADTSDNSASKSNTSGKSTSNIAGHKSVNSTGDKSNNHIEAESLIRANVKKVLLLLVCINVHMCMYSKYGR